jgi:hypothetical protein
MKALIYIPDSRLCQVTDQDFPVAHEFMWVDCDADVLPETHDYQDGAFVLKPDVVLSNFYSQCAPASLDKVNALLAGNYTGLELAAFKKNNALIGVDAVRAYTVDGAPTGSTLLSLRTLTNDAINLGVPLFVFVCPQSGITLEDFTDYFAKLGFVHIVSMNGGNHMTLPVQVQS